GHPPGDDGRSAASEGPFATISLGRNPSALVPRTPPRYHRPVTDHSLQLGPFRLETAIGKGGMGTVWQARHVAQDVRVAIKVLASEVAQDPTLLAAFRNEVRAVAALHHPNVVMVLDHGEIPPAVQQATDNLLTAGSP